MADTQEAIRRLRIEATERGVDETTAKLRDLGKAHAGVTVESQKTEKATLSMERRLNSIQKQYDQTYRAAQAMAKVERDLNLAQQQGLITATRKNQLLQQAADYHNRAANSARGHATALNTLTRIYYLLIGSAILRGLGELLDTGTRIQNNLRVAGLEGEQLRDVYERLYASAQRNAAPLEALTQLYGRAALVQKELRISTEDLLNFTDKVAVALRVSGRSAQESSGALLQLSQALGSGTVRAEEFNSILEGALPIAQAAAAGLKEAGGSVAKLRGLIVEGKVSSEAFFRAFEAGASTLEEKVAGTSLTISQGFTRLENSLVDSIGRLNEATGTTSTLANVMANLAYGIGLVTDALTTVLPGLNRIISFVNSLPSGVLAGAGPLGQIAVGLRGLTSEPPADLATALERAANRQRPRNQFDEAFGSSRPISLGDYPASGGGASKVAGRLQKQFDDALRATEKQTAALRAQADTYGMAAGAAAEYQKRQELINLAAANGIKLSPQVLASIEDQAAAYGRATDELEKMKDAAEAQQFLARSLFDSVRGANSLAEAFANLAGKIGEAALEAALLGSGPLAGIFGTSSSAGGILGAGFGAILKAFGVMHGGGVVGQSAASRYIHPAYFDDAPRFGRGGIAGLGPDEVPIIAHREEEVVRRDDPRHRANGGGRGISIVQSITIDARGADAATIARIQAEQVPQIVRAAAAGAIEAIRGGVGNDRGFIG